MDTDADKHWQHLRRIATKISQDYGDAIFIGGVATYYHALDLGKPFLESSHDADLYLSLVGKSMMRDEYEIRRTPHLNKDSVVIEGEDVDLYVEHQHSLGIPYDVIASHAEFLHGARVAAREHLLVLKIDAAHDRWGTGKGEKDVRDISRIVALLDAPRTSLLQPFHTKSRTSTLETILKRRDIPDLLRLPHQARSEFQQHLNRNGKRIEAAFRGHDHERSR